MSSEGAQDVDERIRQREEQDAAAAAGEAGAVAGAAAAVQVGAALAGGAIQGSYLSRKISWGGQAYLGTRYLGIPFSVQIF